jgi:hypothetical protein
MWFKKPMEALAGPVEKQGSGPSCRKPLSETPLEATGRPDHAIDFTGATISDVHALAEKHPVSKLPSGLWLKKVLILTHLITLFAGLVLGAFGSALLLNWLLEPDTHTTWRPHNEQVQPAPRVIPGEE